MFVVIHASNACTVSVCTIYAHVLLATQHVFHLIPAAVCTKAFAQMHLGLVTQLPCKLAWTFYVINLHVFVIDVQW